MIVLRDVYSNELREDNVTKQAQPVSVMNAHLRLFLVFDRHYHKTLAYGENLLENDEKISEMSQRMIYKHKLGERLKQSLIETEK